MEKQIKDGYTVVQTYTIMTDAKVESLGQKMSVKQAFDLWWNRIDFTSNGKEYFGYKQLDSGKYYIEDKSTHKPVSNQVQEELLKQTIQLEKGYDMDADGNPIIAGNLILKKQLIR